MIQKFVCSDGTVYAFADEYEPSVDEVIAFLEQFRGKRFWNGAAGDVAFRLDGDVLCCDSREYQYRMAYEQGEDIGVMVESFVDSGKEVGTEDVWRKRMVKE